MCSLGRLGLITCDEPQEITYHDGNKGVAWTGIQLTEGEVNGRGGDEGKVFHQKIGDPWSSRTPVVVGYIDQLVDPPGEGKPKKVWQYVLAFALALYAHLKQKDDPRWGDTWLKRTRKGQEERTIGNYRDKFDKFLNGGQPIDWLAISGDAMICWTREQHPEIWSE